MVLADYGLLEPVLATEDYVNTLFDTDPGTYWFVKPVASGGADTNAGNKWTSSFATIQKAITSAGKFDTIWVAPGSYDETLAIAATKSQLTIRGAGPRGSVFVEPSAAGAEGCQVLATDVTFVNLGVAGEATSDYALNVKGNTASKNGKRFTAMDCKFELGDGVGPAVLLNGDANYQASDARFVNSEFAYAGFGIQFDDSSYGYPTQIEVNGCKFRDIATAEIGLATGGGVAGLRVLNCSFENKEDGTAPTDYIKVDRVGDTGLFAGNQFATATNAATVLTIASGIKWGPNGTEAGWSTARPV